MYKITLALMRTIMLGSTYVFTSIVFAQNIIDDGSPAGSTNTPGMTSDVPSIPDTTDTFSPPISPGTPLDQEPPNQDIIGSPFNPGTPGHPLTPVSPRSPATPSTLDSSGTHGTKR
ncbi:hypothetical protein [Nitrosomonas sp. Nm34]|uniref:hypothetical protein n=1 Tax=Nitrosomonas sp. Nm34 TaxID=1881055 RepID=UPI0008EE4C93|nr:hypothetical protein [Nitrosomonas sp. Nm34]SFJ13418.1 hypothetical protein SAMN05428978_11231 [Nitrosomonas sp. Nm34]